MKTNHIWTRLVSRTVLAALLGLASAGSAKGVDPPLRLFALATASATAGWTAAAADYRIELDPEVLKSPAPALEIELPGQAPRQLQRVSRSLGWRHAMTWYGRLEAPARAGGRPAIDAVLTLRGGALSGLLLTEDDRYQIVPAAGGGHRLAVLDPSRFPACAGAIPAPRKTLAPGSRAKNAALLAPVPPTVIDVLALYTPQARIDAGGVEQVEATIQNAVDVANAAYLNSEIETRLRLLHLEEVAYTESGALTADLLWLSGNAGVAALRDVLGADLVSLVLASGDGCGAGFVPTTPDPSAAFQVTVLDCAVGNMSLAHEIGHNQGCEHDPDNSSRWPYGASYPWSFGHLYDGAYRTVMALDTSCVGGCPRELFFSNAGVDFAGLPTGVADERENYRTINATAAAVADYRQQPPDIFADGFESGELDAWSCASESECAVP